MSRPALLAPLALCVLVSGCASTRDQAARVVQEGSKAFEAKGLRLTTSNREVEVGKAQVLRDPNGTAVVVELENRSPRTLGSVPLALTVSDGAGKPIWRNDAAGIQTSLASVGVLPRGRAVTWVNDQVLPPAGVPASAEVQVGEAGQRDPEVPALTAEQPVLEGDPVDGVAARGQLVNGSDADLKDVVVTGVARRGDAVVAAGRAVVPRLKPRAKAGYVIFFIGDPRGAKLSVAAAPTGGSST